MKVLSQLYSNRRQLNWEKVNNPKTLFAVLIATVFGAGLLPWAPGTMGAAAALPVAFYTQNWTVPIRILFWAFIFVIGTWAALIFDQTMQTEDNQNIVVDEFLGLGISAWTAGQNVITWLVAFGLFRFFDALKPPPVRQIDSWSKKQTSPLVRAFGVIADDLMAAFISLTIIVILQRLEILT